MIAVGIDPGTRSTGIVGVRSNGPDFPTVLFSETVKVPAKQDPSVTALQVMRVFERCLVVIKFRPEVVGVEDYRHRPWLGRAVNEAARMGRLCGLLVNWIEKLNLRVVEIAPDDSKAGFTFDSEKARATVFPKQLTDRHQRDAFLQSMAALNTLRTESRF